ncbi:MAG: ankyrin repeat domain-containing protein [Gammaproteobacteria bacterium]
MSTNRKKKSLRYIPQVLAPDAPSLDERKSLRSDIHERYPALLRQRLDQNIYKINTKIALEQKKIDQYLGAYNIAGDILALHRLALNRQYYTENKIDENTKKLFKKFSPAVKNYKNDIENYSLFVNAYITWLHEKTEDPSIRSEMLIEFKDIITNAMSGSHSSNEAKGQSPSSIVDVIDTKKIRKLKLQLATLSDSLQGNPQQVTTPAWCQQLFEIEIKAKLIDVNDLVNGYNAMHHACIIGSEELVQFLLAHHASTTILSASGSLPSDFALQHEDLIAFNLIKRVVRSREEALTSNQQGLNILHMASYHGNLPLITWLITVLKIDINNPCKQRLQTPLHYAAEYGHDDVIEYLLKSKADYQIKDFENRTALVRAVLSSQLRVIKRFSLRGIWPSIADEKYFAALAKSKLPIDQITSNEVKKCYQADFFRQSSRLLDYDIDDRNRDERNRAVYKFNLDNLPAIREEKRGTDMITSQITLDSFLKSHFNISGFESYSFSWQLLESSYSTLKAHPLLAELIHDEELKIDYWLHKFFKKNNPNAPITWTILKDRYLKRQGELQGMDQAIKKLTTAYQLLKQVFRAAHYSTITAAEKQNLQLMSVMGDLRAQLVKILNLDLKPADGETEGNWVTRLESDESQQILESTQWVIPGIFDSRTSGLTLGINIKIHRGKITSQQAVFSIHQAHLKLIYKLLHQNVILHFAPDVVGLQFKAMQENILYTLRQQQAGNLAGNLSRALDAHDNNKFTTTLFEQCPSYTLLKMLDVEFYPEPRIHLHVDLNYALRDMLDSGSFIKHFMYYTEECLKFINAQMYGILTPDFIIALKNLQINMPFASQVALLAVSFTRPLTEAIYPPFLNAMLGKVLTTLLMPFDLDDMDETIQLPYSINAVSRLNGDHNKDSVETEWPTLYTNRAYDSMPHPNQYLKLYRIAHDRVRRIYDDLPTIVVMIATQAILSGEYTNHYNYFRGIVRTSLLRDSIILELLNHLNDNHEFHDAIFKFIAVNELFFDVGLAKQLGIKSTEAGVIATPTIFTIKDFAQCKRELNKLYLGWLAIHYIEGIDYDKYLRLAIDMVKDSLPVPIPEDLMPGQKSLWDKIRHRSNQRYPDAEGSVRHPDEEFTNEFFPFLDRHWQESKEEHVDISVSRKLQKVLDLRDCFTHLYTLIDRIGKYSDDLKNNFAMFRDIIYFSLTETVATIRTILNEDDPLIHHTALSLIFMTETIRRLVNRQFTYVTSPSFGKHFVDNAALADEEKLCVDIDKNRLIIDITDALSNTLLHKAVENDKDQLVEKLLKKGASTESQNNEGLTALMIAASRGSKAIVNRLLLAGARTDKRDAQNRNALHHAAAGGHNDIAALLVAKDPTQLTLPNSSYDLPAQTASKAGNLTTATFLSQLARDNSSDKISARIEWNTYKTKNKIRQEAEAQFLGGAGGSLETMRAIESRYQFIASKPRDALGATAYLSAAANGYIIIMAWLQKQDPASLKDLDYAGRDALMLASMGGHEQVVNSLLADCPRWFFRLDNQSNNALHFAALHGHKEIVIRLRQHGFDPKQKSNADRTPILEALFNENLSTKMRSEIVWHLLPVSDLSRVHLTLATLAVTCYSRNKYLDIVYGQALDMQMTKLSRIMTTIKFYSHPVDQKYIKSLISEYQKQMHDIHSSYKLGNLLLVSQSYNEALSNYQNALLKWPGDAATLNKIGIAHYFCRDYNQAKEAFFAAHKADPENRIYLDNYLILLGVMKQPHDLLYGKEAFLFEQLREKRLDFVDEAMRFASETTTKRISLISPEMLALCKLKAALRIDPLHPKLLLEYAKLSQKFNESDAFASYEKCFLIAPNINAYSFIFAAGVFYYQYPTSSASENEINLVKADHCFSLLERELELNKLHDPAMLIQCAEYRALIRKSCIPTTAVEPQKALSVIKKKETKEEKNDDRQATLKTQDPDHFSFFNTNAKTMGRKLVVATRKYKKEMASVANVPSKLSF